jgi:hypothetical protein
MKNKCGSIPGACWIVCSVLFLLTATGQARLIITNGYFWDTDRGEYWIPYGFAYQTINPPVFANQTRAQITYDFEEMRRLRANSLRVDFTWGYIEPTNDVFDWSMTDHIVATAESNGLRLFVLIGYQYPPGWFPAAWKAVNQSNQVSYILNYEHPQARAAYTDFIAQVTSRYKDSPAIAAWVLGNEYAYFDLWESADPHLYVGYDTNYSRPSFIAFLTNLYSGSISALNSNWGTAYTSFNDVVMPTEYPGRNDPSNVNQQNRNLPAYHDLIQWRKKSIGDFVALGAVAARANDTNHPITYSMVGGIYSGFDANNTCEDAKTIVARCAAAGAPLDFWSINNYAWALEGNELRSAQFGIKKYQDQSGLPVLVTETGHSSTENLFPGAAARQGAALPGQLWEALMAGAMGVHIFTWNDRPFTGSQIREAGFGIVQTNRLIKSPVFEGIRETFALMEQISLGRLLGGSRAARPDVYFYWGVDADMVWPRANQENCMLWGGLKRLGFEPRFLDETGYDAGLWTNSRALVLSHAFMMRNDRLEKLTNVLAAGVHIHANGTLPGRYNAYHAGNPSWAGMMSNAFGLNAIGATNTWHGGIAGYWDQPYVGLNLRYSNSLGALGPGYPWTNVATWIRMSNLTAVAGTTYVWASFGTATYPALHVKNSGAGKAAINTWTLGDTVDMWWLNPRSQYMVWQLHYDWLRAIYREAFGLQPAVNIAGSNYFYVIPDWRVCSNGSILISLLNESTNPVTVTVSATGLITGLTVEQLSAPRGVLESPCDGSVEVSLQGDEYVLLYAYTNAASLVNSSSNKVWISNAPLQIWPNGSPIEFTAGYDTRGAPLSLQVRAERSDLPFIMPYATALVASVSGVSNIAVSLTLPDADLNDPYYVSSAEGALWRLCAALLNGGATQSEVRLPVRLTWGARPDVAPSPLTPGQTCTVAVSWQELPSYQPAEIPTPLSRADVWQPSAADEEIYTVVLDLMSNATPILSTGILTSVGSSSAVYQVVVPAGAPTSAWWRARAVSGNQLGPTSNNHDYADGFETRARGEGADKLAPWQSFAYAQNNNASLAARGVHDLAFEGTNGAFLACSITGPNAWAGFGMYYEYATPWTLPGPAQRSNIVFSFAFRETNGYTGTLEMKVEDGSGGALSYTQPYTGSITWSNIRARLTQFTGSVNTADIRRLTVLLQAGQRDVTYLGCFDAISFTGTPYEVQSPPMPTNQDLHTSFEGLARGSYVNPTPWTLASYGDGSEQYVIHGIDTNASHGTNGHYAVYTSHTNAGGWSGFYLLYSFASPPMLPTNLAAVRFSVDFYENDGDPCDIELQLKSAGGMSTYSRAYNHTPGGWDTISASLDQFTGNADTANLTQLAIFCIMKGTNVTYTGHFDNIRFTGTVSEAQIIVTNGLYESRNDRSPSTDDIPNSWLARHYLPLTTGIGGLDHDGDGFDTWEEYAADTDPQDAGSYFKGIQWWSVSGATGQLGISQTTNSRTYFVLSKTNLLDGLPWLPYGVWAGGAANGGAILLTVTNDALLRFYRLGARP